MVQDGMRNMGSKGTVPDEAWMRELKGAAATAFLGVYSICYFFPQSLTFSTYSRV